MATIKKEISWPVGIALFYAIFVMALLGFLVFSTLLNNDLVSDNYYAKELKHQDQIDRTRNATKLGYKINWYLDKSKGAMVIQFPGGLDFTDIKGIITLFRPSDADMDIVFSIAVNPDGKQYIKTHNLKSGNWRLKIKWQNSEGEFYQDGQVTLP